ncbi:MAG: glucose-1-phosphate thymidylyltransferase [Candidatus Altiarchaeota archaeon]|nr:glucose-1-phosphate thymidylyltransferase [Candidatus Altiarchaeota archaeon]
MKGLILSGGHGTRLRPLTYSQQKQLIPVANKPILFYALEDLVECGIKELGVIVTLNKNQVMETVGDGSRWGVNTTFIEQEKPLGLAHAVKISRDFLGDDSFVMYLGDNILKGGIARYVEQFRKSDADASILLTHVENPEQFGVAQLNKDGSVRKLIEKPKNPPSDLALVGIYMFTSKIFDAVKNIKPSGRNELEITDAIQYLIDHNLRVDSAVVDGWWKDTGKPEDIIEANHLVLDELTSYNKGTLEADATIRGKVAIGKDTIIHKGSVVKGPVVIGRNCEIGPNTYIGPYTSIGDNCRIVDGDIEYSVIMDNTLIKSKKKIVDSLIGSSVRIFERNKLPKGHKFVIGDNSEVEI